MTWTSADEAMFRRSVTLERRLWRLIEDGRPAERLIDAMDASDIEATVWDYPDLHSPSLVVLAGATLPAGADVSGSGFDYSGWMDEISCRLSFEWMRRKGAVSFYAVEAAGARWQADPTRLTVALLDDLRGRHPALHRFAAALFIRSLWLDGIPVKEN